MAKIAKMQDLTQRRKTTRQAVEEAIDRAKLDRRATWYSLLSRPPVPIRTKRQSAKKAIKK